jgi:hypothetical protein
MQHSRVKMKLPYYEGSAFWVPLRTGGFARGVVARATRRGRGICGYFFGPRFDFQKDFELGDLHPNDAVLRVRFGDLGLIRGEWKIIGQVPNWDRSKWPMPDFVRRDPFSKIAWLVRYSDTDPNKVVGEFPTTYDFVLELERDVGWGYGAVELKLTKLLDRTS